MKNGNESSSLGFKPIVKSWNKLLVWGFIVVIGVFASGCNKEKSVDTAEYNVKYEVSSSTIYIGGKLDVTLNSENNSYKTIRINQRGKWEAIIGPVKRGFNATMSVTSPTQTHDKLKLYTNIYVSKNDSPFALKESDGSDAPRDFVKLRYTIDY